jgi:prepilin-type N-terminal cleavage/methylation domain-containing protein
MLSTIRKHKQKGFTIIEVLIVLAIAGLIMLVVFLAVPALQRNARNTQRSNDVASILGAVNEFTNNNNGLLPDTATVAAGTLTVSNAATTGTNNVTTKLGYYKVAGNVSVSATAPGTTGANTSTTSTVIIYTGADCNTIGTQAINGQSRSIAATYTLEATAKECKAS